MDGGWSNFTFVTNCSVKCGNGTRNQTRYCSNPPPQYGGKMCNDSFNNEAMNETQEVWCREKFCPGKYPELIW